MSEENSNSPRPISGIDPKTIRIGSHPPATQSSTPPTSPSSDEQGQSPVVQHPEISTGERLLSALWRSPDRTHQIGILDRQSNSFRNIPVKDAADAASQEQALPGEGHEVYFACAEYKSADSRTAANASGACGFWLDIDVGEDKAATGKGYATIEEAEDALRQFCSDAGLPLPTHVVHSGGGLHAYWVTDGVINRDTWQTHARQLKELTKALGFLADDSRTADIASVLRVPGTLNHKYSQPRPVTLEHASDEPIILSVMLDTIAEAHSRLCSAEATTSDHHLIADTAGSADAHRHGPPDLKKLISALTALDPDCDEEIWKLKRLAPLAFVARNHPERAADLRELARAWSSGGLAGKASKAWTTPGGDGLTGEQAFDSVWQRFLDRDYPGAPATLGTVYHDATQAGWNDPSTVGINAPIDGRRDHPATGDLPFPIVEPSPDPVDPDSLLDEIAHTIRRFIVMEPEQADAAALWVAFTWCIDVAEVAPLAIINAPEKECGKSQLLDVIGRMSARPLPVANATPASLFRAVERWCPTLLIDEADTFIRENHELKGLINAGHTRTNAFVLRTVGENHEPKRFTVWSPKAMAGINLERHLSDSTMSRAVVIKLRRKLQHEPVTRLRHAEQGSFEGIAARLARFSDDYAERVQLARPALPDALSDRAQDNWEPLLAIAECAGPDWVQRATSAALKLSGTSGEGMSTSNELLADIRDVFRRKQIEKIKTADLIDALVEDDEKSWATYNRGKPLSPRQLGRLLSGYGIKSKTVRFDDRTPKGYEASQFTDAFTRYLSAPGGLPQRRNDPPDSSNGEAGCVSDAESVAETLGSDET